MSVRYEVIQLLCKDMSNLFLLSEYVKLVDIIGTFGRMLFQKLQLPNQRVLRGQILFQKL